MANGTPANVLPAPDDDLCLAYANTRYWRGTAAPTEQLSSRDDLLRWAAATERLPARMIVHLRAAAISLGDAISLREVIFRIFAATARGRQPAGHDLLALNAALAAAPPRQCLRLGGWEIGTPDPSVSVLLTPTLWSAADLLVGTRLQRVRQCANPECGWLFLDGSKSGNRRWCSMSACGNRAKAHRHYQRQKER
jgi:predicted RNA-binding Zn ribbon-like protein